MLACWQGGDVWGWFYQHKLTLLDAPNTQYGLLGLDVRSGIIGSDFKQ